MVQGLPSIIQAYRDSVSQIKFAYPTLFSPCINRVKSQASLSKFQKKQFYYILLILTDGDIHDFQEILDSLVICSKLPMSMIIIGIGDRNFEKLEIFLGD